MNLLLSVFWMTFKNENSFMSKYLKAQQIHNRPTLMKYNSLSNDIARIKKTYSYI